MAGDRHGKHNTTTISFRVNSYEKATIEERVKVSGMNIGTSTDTNGKFRFSYPKNKENIVLDIIELLE